MNWRVWIPTVPVRSGLIAGVAGLVVSLASRGWIQPRYLGDPLPLAQAFPHLTLGLLYFNWRAPLAHLLFAAALGVAAAVLVGWQAETTPSPGAAKQAARLAAVINVGAVSLLLVDAFIVFVWYVLGGILSLIVASTAAAWGLRLWQFFARRQNVKDYRK